MRPTLFHREVSIPNPRETMFGFLVRKKHDEVRTLFAGYVNRNSVPQIGDSQRKAKRGAFCEVVWLIPLDSESHEPQFPSAVPILTKDICKEGLSVLHTQPLADELVMIAMEGDVSTKFVVCRREHCTPMGYGFYQIGLQPQQLIDLSPTEEHEFLRRRRLFESNLSAAETV
ncbi:MAG: hypothetical protein HON53_06280 [Planctomycetaceae bacterium]|nr:hypothetical protein [Planctomycetaceae bacterium]MBT6156922.1 hypothetical protein [Planctomycetaceae bacterium]